jgi:diguanylate cyclase (GGDEF)-like protein
MSSFAQERVIKSLTSQSFSLCQKLARIENESSLYAALDEIVAEVAKDCEIDAAALVMRKPHQPDFTSFLHDLHSFGMSQEEKKRFSFFLAQAVVPEVIQRMQPMTRDDVRLDVAGNQAVGLRSKMVSMMAVPMMVHQEVAGIFIAFRSEIGAFCVEDGVFFQRIASLIAEDIEGSGAFLRLAKDSATGFYSRRVFFEALAQETARARRYQAPLSAIVLEVEPVLPLQEGAKKTLELFLKRFSQRIASETRQSDIVARASESSFLFLQPMTSAQNAFEFASRVCEHFKQHPITLNESTVQIRMSAGVSTLYLEDEDGSAMLRRADMALDAARKRGQGEVAVFEER